MIAFLIFGSLQKKRVNFGNGDDNSVVGVVMINPKNIGEHYSYHYINNNKQNSDKLYQKKMQQQLEKLQQKKKAEQKYLTRPKKSDLVMPKRILHQDNILEKQNKEQKNTAEEVKKQINIVKSTTSKLKKESHNFYIEAQSKAQKGMVEGNNTLLKKTEEQNKKKINTDKQHFKPNDQFNVSYNTKTSLTGWNKNKEDQNTLTGKKNVHTIGASSTEIKSYIGQVQSAIQSKFYNPDSFSGKSCHLRIKIAPNGFLMSVQVIDGHPALCNAAVSATKLAHIPKPPNDTVYLHIKVFTLEFKP